MNARSLAASSLAFTGCLAGATSVPQSNSASSGSAAGWWGDSRDVLLDLGAWDSATTEVRRAAAVRVDERFEDFTLVDLAKFEAGTVHHEVAVFKHGPTGLEFVLIPGGTFLMGSPPSEEGRSPNEAQHEVGVWPFLMARTETTQVAWAHTMIGTNPSKYQGDTLPVESVNWQSVSDFCGRQGLALPTEAEWEYAARAGSTTAFFTGPAVASLDGYANASDAWLHDHPSEVPYGISNFSYEMDIHDGHGTTAPVGSYKTNAFGLYDMIGNVLEWCEGVCAGDSARGAREGQPSRPVRGGNWASTLPMLRGAARHGVPASGAYDGVGFRAVKHLQE